MSFEPIDVILTGLDSDKHAVRLSTLSETLSGLNRLASSSIYLLENLELPRGGQRSKYDIMVYAPEANCFKISFIPQVLKELLPLTGEPLNIKGKMKLGLLIGAALLINSNRVDEAEQTIRALTNIIQEQQRYSDISEQRWFEMSKLLAENNKTACAKCVSNLGNDASHLEIPLDEHSLSLNENDATIIRQKAEDEEGEIAKFKCTIDSLTLHNKTVRVQIDASEEDERYITADVIDDSFNTPDNPYIVALNTKRPLIILARPILRDGRIVRLKILEAVVEHF